MVQTVNVPDTLPPEDNKDSSLPTITVPKTDGEVKEVEEAEFKQDLQVFNKKKQHSPLSPLKDGIVSPSAEAKTETATSSGELHFGALLFQKVVEAAQRNPKFHQVGSPFSSLRTRGFDVTKPLTLEIVEVGKNVFEPRTTLFKGIYDATRTTQAQVIQQDPEAIARLNKYQDYLGAEVGSEVSPELSNLTMRLNGVIIFQIQDGVVAVNKLAPQLVQQLTVELEELESDSELDEFVEETQDRKEEEQQSVPPTQLRSDLKSEHQKQEAEEEYE